MSGGYWGDFPVNAVVRIPFDSFDGGTGASITMTGYVAADIEVYKNGGTTQRASDNGYTATTDFDTITGLHFVVIDTSDNSDAGFYAAGNEYQVAVSTVTIDGQTVSFWAGTFSIERSGGTLALLKDATFGLSALETLVDDLETRVPDTISLANINAEMDTALTDIHLDHLLAADYDPAAKPGVATALLNELVENDGGVSRFTSNALEQIWAVTTRTLSALGFSLANSDFAAGAIDAAAIADNAIGAAELATDAVNEIRDAILNDSTPFNGADIDAAITTRATPAEVLTQARQALKDMGLVLMRAAITVTDQTNVVVPVTDDAVDDNAYLNQVAVFIDQTDPNQISVRYVTGYVAATRTVTINAAPDFTIATGDILAIVSVGTLVTVLGTGVIDANAIATAAIDADAIAANAIGASELATDAVQEIRDAILSDSTPFAGANIDAAISTRATPAQVNTEVLDVLNTDTFAEPGQGAPPATTTIFNKINYLYKSWRNKMDNDGSTTQLYDDGGSTVDQKATTSEAAGTVTRGKWASGP